MNNNNWTYEIPTESGNYWAYQWARTMEGDAGLHKIVKMEYVNAYSSGYLIHLSHGDTLIKNGNMLEPALRYLAWKKVPEPDPPKLPTEIALGECAEEKPLGYIVFTSESGCIDSTGCKLLTAEEAIEEGKAILQEYWKADRYANPEHPSYDAEFEDSIEDEYEEKRREIEDLVDCDLNNEDELIFMPILP